MSSLQWKTRGKR